MQKELGEGSWASDIQADTPHAHLTVSGLENKQALPTGLPDARAFGVSMPSCVLGFKQPWEHFTQEETVQQRILNMTMSHS